MIKRLFGMICLVNVAHGTTSCKTHVCFNWKVTSNELKLTCKVSRLQFRIWILDQFGSAQASCVPPPPSSKCEPYYKNGTISQNPKTNETFFTVNGHIDNHINGNWTCRHGRRREIAHVEITVLRMQEKKNTINFGNRNKNLSCKPVLQDSLNTTESTINGDSNISTKMFHQLEENNCVWNVIMTATLGVLGSIITSIIIISYFKTVLKGIDDCCLKKCIPISKKTLICKKITFALLTMLFLAVAALCGWLDNKTCNSKWIFLVIGIAFGFINSLLFLPDVDQKNNTHQPDQDAGEADLLEMPPHDGSGITSSATNDATERSTQVLIETPPQDKTFSQYQATNDDTERSTNRDNESVPLTATKKSNSDSELFLKDSEGFD